MLKCTREGVVEFGGINHLDEEDMFHLACDIAQHTSLPTLRKVNGVWQQMSSLEVMDPGYRIHEVEEEEDAVDQLNSLFDDLLIYKQAAA